MATKTPQITRTKHGGRIYSWEVFDAEWPGRSSFVRLEVFEVTIGDRYAEEGHTSTFSCHPEDFIGGCFHGFIGEGFGSAALAEMVAEVKARGDGSTPLKNLPRPEAAWRPVRSPFAPVAKTPSKPAAKKRAAVVAKSVVAKPTAKPAVKKPAAKKRVARRKPAAAASRPRPAEGNVNIALTGCRKVDLALVAALRGLTGQSASSLKVDLQRLPMMIKTDVSFAEGRAIQRRLGGLGATVSLAS